MTDTSFSGHVSAEFGCQMTRCFDVGYLHINSHGYLCRMLNNTVFVLFFSQTFIILQLCTEIKKKKSQ